MRPQRTLGLNYRIFFAVKSTNASLYNRESSKYKAFCYRIRAFPAFVSGRFFFISGFKIWPPKKMLDATWAFKMGKKAVDI